MATNLQNQMIIHKKNRLCCKQQLNKVMTTKNHSNIDNTIVVVVE